MPDGDVHFAELFAQIIRGRRTIGKFADGCPPCEILLEAIEVARWAPNHHHTEPWTFHLLGCETACRLIDLNTELVRQHKGEAAAQSKRQRWSLIPGWLAVTCHLTDDPATREEDYAACCCAIQNLSLYLWTRGIGVKWSTGEVTRAEAFYRLLEVDPERSRVVGLLSYGYPLSVPQSRRRPVDEIVQVHA